MKKTFLWAALLNGAFALGFGSMGNTSAGLGDSGVALRKSPWGIYYNPALLASDNRGKFGYSAGAGVQGLDPSIFDFAQNQATQAKHIRFTSENGIVAQITGGTRKIPVLDQEGNPTDQVIEERSSIGAVGIGGFVSFYIDGIIGEVNQTSISSITLVEVPIAWGWRFQTNRGDLSIGASLKYMGASALGLQSLSNIEDLQNLQLDSLDFHNAFGVDLGILYSPLQDLHLGLVAKNINTPSFNLLGRNLKIYPQFRLGLSYEFAQYFTLSFDADLVANYISFNDSPKTQMIGGGLLMDMGFIDLRIGLMGDLENTQQGPIITGGINLLGFLDLAVQSNFKTNQIGGYQIPSTFLLKFGGSFTF